MKIFLTIICVICVGVSRGQGIVCIDPIFITPEEQSRAFDPSDKFTVAIDGLPAQTISVNDCGFFTDLDIIIDHTVVIKRNGNPEASFKFNFKSKGSNHLRLWFRTQYQTWQLWKSGRKHQCAYLKIPVIQYRLVAKDNYERLASRTTQKPPEGFEWIKDSQSGKHLLVEKESFDIHAVFDVSAVKDSFGNDMLVAKLFPEDAQKFAELTRDNVGRQLAIFVLGKYCFAPGINAEIIGGRIQASLYPDNLANAVSQIKAKSKKYQKD